MSRVVVKEDVLLWAIERAGLTPDGLRRKFPNIQHWINGEKKPTLRQLESLSKTTFTPLGYFFLSEPPEDQLPIPHYRTYSDEAPSRPSPNLLESVRAMQGRQDWMREYLIEQGQEPLPFIRSVQLSDPPEVIADHIRRSLKLDEGWAANKPTWTDALRTLRENIEDAGILVVVNGIVGNNTRRKLDPGEFRGFVLVDEYVPLVFVNGADGKAAQMFTLAHELAHVFVGSSAAFDLREMLPADDPTEKACNLVAAEFLVPERKLREVWDSVRSSLEPFQAIARRFKVSEIVAARRAFDLTLINRDEFIQFYRGYIRRPTHVRRPGGGDFYANQNLRVGRRFASTVVRAAKEGKLLYSEAYRLTGLYGKTFNQYASELGVRGIQ